MAELAYPTIEGPTFAFLDAPCLAFEKYDGSNLRFFWDQKRGWHSTGTRYRWFKAVTPMFGPDVAMFERQSAQGIIEIVRRSKEYRGVNELVVFCEFFGPARFRVCTRRTSRSNSCCSTSIGQGPGSCRRATSSRTSEGPRSPRSCTRAPSAGRSSKTSGSENTRSPRV